MMEACKLSQHLETVAGSPADLLHGLLTPHPLTAATFLSLSYSEGFKNLKRIPQKG